MPNYSATAAEFEDELRRLINQKEEWERQIANVTKALEAVKVLAQESNEPLVVPPDVEIPSGFTDRVRTIVRANFPRPVTAVEVRDALSQSDPQDDPKIMLIHVHNTLKRLHRQGEVEMVAAPEGRAAYIHVMESVGKIAMRTLSTRPVVTEAKGKGEYANHPAQQLKRRKTFGEKIGEKE